MKVPFLNPDIRNEDIVRMVKSVRSGWLVYGPYAKQMEQNLAKFLHAPYALLTSSCTSALHEAVILAGNVACEQVLVAPQCFRTRRVG